MKAIALFICGISLGLAIPFMDFNEAGNAELSAKAWCVEECN